jgi:site-specific DNA recombinase
MRIKKVVGYARISTEEQSHFSIDGQIEQIELYCQKHGYELAKTFVDEGQSAKDFDRKNWKVLDKYLTAHYKEIDYLVVMKYDRFSRNIQQSLNVIHQLEDNYKIKIVSISEPIGLPPESPFYFQLRTTMLLNAHVERLVIRDRTIFGQRKARSGGRYLGLAPYGYINARDLEKKPIIVIVPEEAEIIRKIFCLYLQNYTIAEIERLSKAFGFTKTGKDRIQTLLKNTVYVGLIRMKAYQDEGETFVQGIHEPIIDKDTFYRVQARIARPAIPKRLYNETTYLKGAIVCNECFKPMTSGQSKGRRKYYWYYECYSTPHRKSFNADKAHEKFDAILNELDFTDAQLSYLEASVKEKLQKEIDQNLSQIPILLRNKTILIGKKEKLEEKYLSSKIDDNTFLHWNTKLSSEIEILTSQLRASQAKENDYWNAYFARFANLKNISDVFRSASLQSKQNFIERGFGKELTYNGEVFRTAYLNPLFISKAVLLKGKGLLEYNKKTGISEKSPSWVNDRVRTGDPRHHKPML